MSNEHEHDDTAVVPHGRHRHRSFNKPLAIALGFFGALAPTVAAYISYRQAKVEASTANQKTSKEAESGYGALKSYAETLKAIVTDQDARIAENTILVDTIRESLQQQIDVLKTALVEEHISGHHHHDSDKTTSDIVAPAKPAQPYPPAAAEPPPTKYLRTLPKDLRDAADSVSSPSL